MDGLESPALRNRPRVRAEILRRLRRLLRDWYPSFSLRINAGKRNRITAEYRRCQDVADVLAFAQKYLGICQKPLEIEKALEVMATISPHSVCEIGAATGGNSLLLSTLPTVDLVICLDLCVQNKAYLRLLRRPSQHIFFVDGSSYSPGTVAKVEHILNGRTIDVLFIDGDHRYEGVASDFLCYRHLVSEGGLVLFHDIMPDGGDGWLWSGGVPTFWQEVKCLYPHQEFVAEPHQKAFGIGLIRYSGTIELPPGFGAGGVSGADSNVPRDAPPSDER